MQYTLSLSLGLSTLSSMLGEHGLLFADSTIITSSSAGKLTYVAMEFSALSYHWCYFQLCLLLPFHQPFAWEFHCSLPHPLGLVMPFWKACLLSSISLPPLCNLQCCHHLISAFTQPWQSSFQWPLLFFLSSSRQLCSVWEHIGWHGDKVRMGKAGVSLLVQLDLFSHFFKVQFVIWL